jgi:hypothetical protein
MRHPTRPTLALAATSSLSLALLLAVFIAPHTRAAPDSSALINEALDQPVVLKLNTVLPKAAAAIADKTGVKVDVDPAVWDLLPWGEQTNIEVNLDKQTLRAGLEAVAKRLGLVMVLKAQAVELQPMPALRRLGRRATDKELDALYLLSTTPLDNLQPAQKEKLKVDELVEAVDAKLQQVRPDLAVEFRRRDMLKPDQVLSVARNATLADALEALARETPATWYPWGRSIVVLPREMQIRNNQLGRPIDTRFDGVDISQVLVELEQASGVPFEIEPGAVQRIPPESRRVTLILSPGTVQQALEAISGYTGLDYVVKGDGIYIWNQSAGTATSASDPAVGMIQLDNGVQVMLRRSQLPADVQEYIDYRKNKAIANLRQMMQEEGFKPTTQPSSQPGTAPRGEAPSTSPRTPRQSNAR